MDQEKKQIEALETLLSIVTQLENKILDLEQCSQAFKKLQVYFHLNKCIVCVGWSIYLH